MKTVWKYPLPDGPWSDIAMPRGARILSVGLQDSNGVLWVEADPAVPFETRTFATYLTGDTLADKPHIYLATLQYPTGFVLHVYELEPIGEREEANDEG